MPPKYEPIALSPGPACDSVEDLLRSGAEALAGVGSGVVATLRSPAGRFRLLSEDDFQALFGTAQDLRRVSAELNSVLSAAREQPAADTAQDLIARVAGLADSLRALPVRTGHEPLGPTGSDLDESDLDLVLDAAELYS